MMRSSPALLVTIAALAASPMIAACGGSGTTAGTSPSSAPTTTTASTPSATPSVDVDAIGQEAQSIGLDVEAYEVHHNFTFPADEAQFRAKVKLTHPLAPGSKVGYEKVGAKNFRVCVTSYAGGKPVGWAVFDGRTGLPKGAAGAPTDKLCP